jgi:hypothetical protein
MDITLLAHKNLDSLDGYIDIKHERSSYFSNFLSGIQFLDRDEKIIGFYINEPLKQDFIVITSQRLVVGDLNRQTIESIRYDDIQDVHTEPIENANKIFIRQKNGSSNSILVSGIKNDKFLDIYGFLRFIKKILVNINLNNGVGLTV